MASFVLKKFGRFASLDESHTSEKKQEYQIKTPDGDPEAKVVIIAAENCNHCEYTFKWYHDNVHRQKYKVVIVYIIELPEQKSASKQSSGKMSQPLGGMQISPKTLQELWKKEEEKTIELEQTMRRLLKERRCTGILRTAAGKPGPMICKVAAEEGASMIVTGSRNLGRMKRVLIGSVSDYLVHHAVCPVIVCRLPTIQRSASVSDAEDVRQRHFSDSTLLASLKGKGKKTSLIDRIRHKSAGSKPQKSTDEVFEEEKENGTE